MVVSTSTNIVAFRRDGGKNLFAYCIEQCASAGYQVLDLNLCEAMNPHSRFRDDDWEQYVTEIAQAAQRWGVTFSQSHLPYYDLGRTEDETKIKLMEELIRRAIIASGQLGIKWAVTHPGTYGTGQDDQESLEKNVAYYAKHLELAKKMGVGLALENDFGDKTKPHHRVFGASIPALIRLVDALNSPAAGVCYDFGHAHLNGASPAGAGLNGSGHRQNLALIGPRLKALHVQDNHGQADEHLLPFSGTIDWAACMQGLADIDYQGDLTFEVQEAGRYLPNELKHLIVEQSLVIGNYLARLFEQAKKDRF